MTNVEDRKKKMEVGGVMGIGGGEQNENHQINAVILILILIVLLLIIAIKTFNQILHLLHKRKTEWERVGESRERERQ